MFDWLFDFLYYLPLALISLFFDAIIFLLSILPFMSNVAQALDNLVSLFHSLPPDLWYVFNMIDLVYGINAYFMGLMIRITIKLIPTIG